MVMRHGRVHVHPKLEPEISVRRQCICAHGGYIYFAYQFSPSLARYLWFRFNFRFRLHSLRSQAILFEAHWMCTQFVNWTSDADECVCVLCRMQTAQYPATNDATIRNICTRVTWQRPGKLCVVFFFGARTEIGARDGFVFASLTLIRISISTIRH